MVPAKQADNAVEKIGGRLTTGLSAKLLWLTIAFIMLAEILIFLPSIANFRNVWLKNHLEIAEAAGIVYSDTADIALSQEAAESLLNTVQATTIALRQDGQSMLLASSQTTPDIVQHIDLDNASAFGSITSSISMLFISPDLSYRVFGKARSGEKTIELVQPMGPIQNALGIYARNVLILSLIISVFASGLVYLALYQLIVRPIIRISTNMDAFSKQPENTSLILKPTQRNDEIGVAEQRLSTFQGELADTLRQKQRLADLGLAVSKINHDLRNILASAQLFSDRLMSLPDPTVQRFAPKLIRTIDRATEYTKSVIDYGRALEAPPNRRMMLLYPVAEEVGELLRLEEKPNFAWTNKIDPSFELNGDPEQIFRILMNLCRNAKQAMEEVNIEDRTPSISISAEHKNEVTNIRVSDSGPGISDEVRQKAFNAFQVTTKAGGSGLGLAIAAELARAHGGEISIEKTSSSGSVFLITIPDLQ